MRLFRLLMVLWAVCLPVSAFAQAVGTPTSTFIFDQPAPDAGTAQGYTFKIYIDGNISGQVLAGVTCVASPTAAVQTCTAPFPAFTPGTHTIQLTASNVAGESAKSAVFTFTLVAVPGAPGNIRIGG